MRYVSINSVPNLSTGAVMRQVTEERRAHGDECWCMWGRGRASQNDYEYNFGSKPEFYLDVLQTRLDGRAGFHSKMATRRLLKKLDQVKPDIVHLHNIHGYYVNVEMLFDWLATHENVQVKWTLHDCWAFTGHCAYFINAKCTQWKDTRECSKGCPRLSAYPKTISKRSSAWNFRHKRDCFTRLEENRMTIVTPSRWLADLTKDSFLGKYPIKVRYNTIDTKIYKPTASDFRERYGIGNRFMVLGVASPWSDRKGLEDFIRLATDLDSARYAIVVVGLSKKQIDQLPACIVGLRRTDSPEELASIYTAADVFFNPTREDNYPTVNLEAEACGTSVITYDTGGCSETIRLSSSSVASDYEMALQSIRTMEETKQGRSMV